MFDRGEKEEKEDKGKHGIIKKLVFRLVKKHIAGSTMSAVLENVRKNSSNGMHTTVTLLNEHVDDANKARYNTNSYLQFIRQMSRLRLNASCSIRLSQLGYGINGQVLDKSVSTVLDEACGRGVPVWLEYEKGISLDKLFGIYRKYKTRCPSLGAELPVMYPVDAETIRSMVRKGDNIKLVSYSFANGSSPVKSRKSIIKNRANESEKYEEISTGGTYEKYIAKIGRLLQSGAKVSVLEPDEGLISKIASFSKEYRKELIFELPLGFNERKARKLIATRVRIGVYLPYGKDWSPYVVNKLVDGRVRDLAVKVLSEG
jgi:proline dehydrogenase